MPYLMVSPNVYKHIQHIAINLNHERSKNHPLCSRLIKSRIPFNIEGLISSAIWLYVASHRHICIGMYIIGIYIVYTLYSMYTCLIWERINNSFPMIWIGEKGLRKAFCVRCVHKLVAGMEYTWSLPDALSASSAFHPNYIRWTVPQRYRPHGCEHT